MAILRNQNAGGTLQQTNARNMRNGGRFRGRTRPMMARGGRTRPAMARGGRPTRSMMNQGGVMVNASRSKVSTRQRRTRSVPGLRSRRSAAMRNAAPPRSLW